MRPPIAAGTCCHCGSVREGEPPLMSTSPSDPKSPPAQRASGRPIHEIEPSPGLSTISEAIADIGATAAWNDVMERTATLADRVAVTHGPNVAQYAVPFAYRVRYYIQMNAREAFHLLELRSQASGHPGYRGVAQDMHRLIREKAGHRVIADAMQYVDHNDYDLARLEEERRLAAKRAAMGLDE